MARRPAARSRRWRRRERDRRRRRSSCCCDISGSMDRYARMLLHFLHALANDRDRVHVLPVRHAAHEHHAALAPPRRRRGARAGGAAAPTGRAARASAPASHEFNRRWSRRLLGQGAIVLLITDGLEPMRARAVEVEMERLVEIVPRLVWLNPLLRYAGFEPRAAGIRAMLPYVDDFLPVHNLESLTQLAAAFDERSRVGRPPTTRSTSP